MINCASNFYNNQLYPNLPSRTIVKNTTAKVIIAALAIFLVASVAYVSLGVIAIGTTFPIGGASSTLEILSMLSWKLYAPTSLLLCGLWYLYRGVGSAPSNPPATP